MGKISDVVAGSDGSKAGGQTLTVEYKDDDEFYINPGIIHIKGTGVDTLYTVAAQLTKTVTSLTANTWYYVYAKPPATGTSITATEIEYSTTAPTRDVNSYGYYHGSNDTWRCIFSFYSNTNMNIEKFYQLNKDIIFDNELTNIGPVTPSTTWTDITLSTPLFEGAVSCIVNFYCAYVDAGVNFGIFYRPNGSPAVTGVMVGILNPAAIRSLVRSPIKCDDSGIIEVRHAAAGTDAITIRPIGFVLPSEVYNK